MRSEVSEVIRRVLHHSISAGNWVKGLMNLADSVKNLSIGGNAPQVHGSRDHWNITTHEIISDRILFTTERCNVIYSVDSVRENMFHYYKRKIKAKLEEQTHRLGVRCGGCGTSRASCDAATKDISATKRM